VSFYQKFKAIMRYSLLFFTIACVFIGGCFGLVRDDGVMNWDNKTVAKTLSFETRNQALSKKITEKIVNDLGTPDTTIYTASNNKNPIYHWKSLKKMEWYEGNIEVRMMTGDYYKLAGEGNLKYQFSSISIGLKNDKQEDLILTNEVVKKNIKAYLKNLIEDSKKELNNN